MILAAYTVLHVAISLAGIVSGLVFLFGLLAGKEFDSWTRIFLATTVATNVSGFFFPFRGITPAIVTGIISMAVLAVALFARYGRKLAGAWRKTYVITAVFALYLNMFVLVVQLFQKIPVLKSLAPTQSELPFTLTQLVVLIMFMALGVLAARRFRSKPVAAVTKEIISTGQLQT